MCVHLTFIVKKLLKISRTQWYIQKGTATDIVKLYCQNGDQKVFIRIEVGYWLGTFRSSADFGV